MSWPFVRFELLYAEPSRNGIYKSAEHHGTGTKIVNMGELFAHEFIGSQDMARLAMSEAELEKSGLVDGDLLFGRRSLVESGAGKCSLVDSLVEPTTFESSIIRVRPDKSKVVPRFYYYWFRSRLGRGSIQAIVSGVNVKGIRGSDLRNVLVPVPTVGVQGSIAAKLSAYDDLIENNRRRIALLEQSARLLYREWFVHLRFPGHEHVNVVDGVPEGWGQCSAFDAIDVMSGGTPKTGVPDYWNGEIPFFTPKDAVDAPYVLDTEKYLTDRGLSACNSLLYPKDTIFITARGTVGNLNLAQVPMAMNQSCYALKGKGYLSQLFLFGALKEAVQQFKSRAGGAVFDAIVVNTFKLIPFLRPPEGLVREYTEMVEPTFSQIDRLLLQSARLREARDLLLPRLMSGVPVV